MLDLSFIRIVSAVLFSLAISGIIISGRLNSKNEKRRFEIKRAQDVPSINYMAWTSVTMIMFITLIVGIIYPALIYDTFFNFQFYYDNYLQIIGFILFSTGGLIWAYTNYHLGRYMRLEIVVAKDHELITSGPYSKIRHPSYTAVILMGLAIPMIYLHALLFINFLIIFTLANYRAGQEEALLSSKNGFGQKYKVYMNRTGRFLPKLF